VNAKFEKIQVPARPSQQFQALFNGVAFTAEQKNLAETLKQEHNQLINQAYSLQAALKEDKGPRLTLTSKTGNSLEVIGLGGAKHPDIFTMSEMNVKIRKSWGKYWVWAEVPNKVNDFGQPLFKSVGSLSAASVKEHGKKIESLFQGGYEAYLGTLSAQIKSGITQSQVDAAFTKWRDYDRQKSESIPAESREAMAAATWLVCHTRTDKVDERSYGKASAAFALFPEEILRRLPTLQFTDFQVTGLRSVDNQHGDRFFTGETLPVEVAFNGDPNAASHNQRVLVVEGKVLGGFHQESPQLPTGTKAQATISTMLGSGVNVTAEGRTFKVGVLKNYSYAEAELRDQEGEFTFTDGKNSRGHSIVIASLKGKQLGEVKEKVDKDWLRQAGYIGTGKSLAVKFDRDSPAVAKVVIDPATVVYPQSQIHDSVLSTERDTSAPLPAVWSRGEDGFTLAVDRRNVDRVDEFFRSYGVAVRLKTEANREADLGYAVVEIDSIPPEAYEKVEKKYGPPLSPEAYQERLKTEEVNPIIELIQKQFGEIPPNIEKIIIRLSIERLQDLKDLVSWLTKPASSD
jgi:hypothetical protein